MRVWYPHGTPRTTGLRLQPGWNEVPVATATVLIERGIVTQKKPRGSASEEATAEDESKESSKEDESTAGRKRSRGRRIIE